MVATETSGNITRPPNRSVSAPTGIRPSDPTMTGTATTRAWANGDRCDMSLNFGPSGDSSAHAQKFTAKPIVATASITQGRDSDAGSDRPAARFTLLMVPTRLLIDASCLSRRASPVFTMLLVEITDQGPMSCPTRPTGS